jgi:hypothetical protein
MEIAEMWNLQQVFFVKFEMDPAIHLRWRGDGLPGEADLSGDFDCQVRAAGAK